MSEDKTKSSDTHHNNKSCKCKSDVRLRLCCWSNKLPLDAILYWTSVQQFWAVYSSFRSLESQAVQSGTFIHFYSLHCVSQFWVKMPRISSSLKSWYLRTIQTFNLRCDHRPWNVEVQSMWWENEVIIDWECWMQIKHCWLAIIKTNLHCVSMLDSKCYGWAGFLKTIMTISSVTATADMPQNNSRLGLLKQ